MIIDGRSDDRAGPLDYDLVVIGAGAAGITLANELDGTGLRVALLESGGRAFDPETQALYDGTVTGLEEIDLGAARLRFLGGTTNHWGGRCVPMDAIDFARAPLSGMTGWPFPRAALDPYYPKANEYCGVGAFDYAPNAAEGVTEGDLLLAGDDIVETVVVRQSSVNFGEKYAGMLEASKNVDLWLWTNVTGFAVTPEGVVESLETRTLSGAERTFRGRQVVLATGGVENPRLMMILNDRNGTSFGDAGELLGRCYMDHPAGGAGFLHPTGDIGEKAYWDKDVAAADGTPLWLLWRLRDEVIEREGLANTQFYLFAFRDQTTAARDREARQGMSALRQIAKWSVGRGAHDFRLSDAYCQVITSTDAMVASTLSDSGTAPVERVLLKYEAEQQPTRDNYVILGEETDAFGLPRPILNWAPSEADRDSILRTTELIGQAAGAADLGRLELEPHWDEPWWGATTSWHQIGTTRMSEGPTDGVVDPDCLVHGTKNLYVAGGSVMPTAGRANPTLTIVALTIRLADHLKAIERS